MEAAGLVTREADPLDGRRVEVRASARAIGLLRRFDDATAALLAEAVDALLPAERAALGAALPALERLRDEMQVASRTARGPAGGPK